MIKTTPTLIPVLMIVRKRFRARFLQQVDRASGLRNRFGGAEGDRTPDLMTASHALSQLSYGPVLSGQLNRPISCTCNHSGEGSRIQSAANCTLLRYFPGSKNILRPLLFQGH